MQRLRQLLEIESDLAWVVRLGLQGLRASLQLALKKNPADPATSIAQELLQELNGLLDTDSQELPKLDDFFEPIQSPEKSLTSTDEGNLKLNHLSKSFLTDPELLYYLGQFQLKSSTDESLWHEMQRLLLRVPASLASTWRHRAMKLAQEVGAVEDRRSLLTLPFYRNEAIYPGLSGSVSAQGLQLSERLGFDPRVDVLKPDGDLSLLAGIVSFYIKFVDIDLSLCHALQSIDEFGLRSLASQSERNRYIEALINCFKRVQAAEQSSNPTIILRARLDLDEAIHSLVYNPPVERDTSWWGKLQQEARQTLIVRARQYNVQIRQLWGTFSDVCAWSKHDLELDNGGIKGEVSACLRVYAKMDDTVLPGRVLFRSLR